MLAWLERNQVLLLVVAVLSLAAGLGIGAFLDDGVPPPFEFHSDAALPDGAPIRVHVAVRLPGVYELRQGDRLDEALAAAGGAREAADLESINLARRLADGEQVVVPRLRGAARPVEALAPDAKVNINTAGASLLDQLPGIGEAYSRRIVDSRVVDGPFTTTDELVERGVIPRATFEQIREMVSVAP